MHLRQRRHFNRIVSDESRLYISAFAEFAEDFVDQFAFAHRVVDFFHLQLFADLTDFFFALAVEVVSCLFFDSVQDRQTAVRSFKADCLSVYNGFGASVHGDTDAFQQLFSEAHHPVVVLVLYVKFHTSEFGVVGSVHSLVTEVLSYFVYTFKSSHDQSFQIKFRCDAQVEVYIQ